MAQKKRTLTRFERVRLFIREPRKFLRFITGLRRNLKLRIFAFVIALIGWACVQIATNEVSVTLTVPLAIDVAEDYHAQAFVGTNRTVSAVTLSLICSPQDRDMLRVGDYAARISLRQEEENVIPSYPLELGRDITYVGPGPAAGRFEVQSVSPDHVRIVIDRSLRKNVLVAPTLVGEPAAGYYIATSNVTPSAVMIDGPARIVDEITSLATEPISLDGFKKSFSGKTRVVTGHPQINVINQPWVQFTVGINARPVTRTLSNIPVSTMVTPDDDMDIGIDPATVTVTVEGHAPLIDTLDRGQVTAYVNARTLTSGQFTLPVQVAPLRNYRILAVSPAQVTVTVDRYSAQ